MNKGLFIWIVLWCFNYNLSAQNFSIDSGTTRAVVIGISDYQEENIPDLRFADRDAVAFADYLQSPAGGALAPENIMRLTNEAATTGAIASAMDWLLADSEEGDRVIIYFSGHGDVETRTKFQRGFLLTHDSPPSNYLAGAFALIFLQDIISTLSDQGVQVVMISDACRAGKLAGSDIGGSQATAANLAKQFANEIKILSCQPDEFSLEGEQWGGGRGAFSYHLIDGLIGLADGNEDHQINLFEAGRYLEDKVSKETAPQMQIPMTVGSKSTVLAFVDEASLAAVQERKEKESPLISAIDTRGFEDVIVSQLDSIHQEKYRQFVAALAKGELLKPKGSSAYDLYQSLSKVEGMERLQGIMLRNLATKLQEESQQAINAYLRADDEELAARSRGEIRYKKFVDYLEKACELLGPNHYMYNSLKAKQHYFHSVDTRIRFSGRTFTLSDSASVWQQWCEESMKEALEYEQNAAYLYNEMGILSRGETRKAYYEKAISLAPKWVIPYCNISGYYLYNKDFTKGYQYAQKALALDPGYSYTYRQLATYHRLQKQYDQEEAMSLKAVEASPGNVWHVISLGDFYNRQKQFEKAELYWLKALELSPKHINLYNKLSTLYLKTKQYNKMEAINLDRIKIRPTDGDGQCDLITAYVHTGQLDKIISLLKKMIEIDKTIPNWEGKTCFGYAYHELGEYDLALKYSLEAIRQAPDNKWSYTSPAGIYRDIGNHEKFLCYVDTMIMKGMSYSGVENRYNFHSASKAPNFKAFAQKMINEAPKNGFGYRLMGNYYDGQLDFKQASQMYKKAVKLSPKNLLTRYNLAKSVYLSDQAKKAESLFQKYIDVSERKANNYNAVGYFYTMHSENELAQQYLEKALEIDSLYQRAFINSAWLLYTSHRQEEAYELIDKAINQLESKDFQASFQLFKAGLYLYAEDHELSLQWLQQSAEQIDEYRPFIPFVEKLVADDLNGAASSLEDLLQKFPGNSEIFYILSRMKAELGESEAAFFYLGKALEDLEHPYDFIQQDPKLDSLREMPKYRKLMQRYFPEKF